MRRLLGFFWALPVSLAGEAVAWACGCVPVERLGAGWDDPIEYICRPDGLLAWWFRRRDFAAFTVGDVIIYRDLDQSTDGGLRAHELRHVEQYRLLGVFFFITYRLLSLLAWAMRRDAYRDNWLEIDARQAVVEAENA